MSKYLIQTRKYASPASHELLTKIFGTKTIWATQQTEYDSLEEAKQKCIELVKKGWHKANDIRIVKVACTFVAEVTPIEN